MSTTTANLGLTLPTPNVASGWGGTLNTDFTLIDDLFTAAGSGTSVGLQVGSGKTLNAGGTIIAGGTMILGSGDGTNTVTPPTIRGAARTGTNAAGGNLTIDAINGTGTGGSGKIIFRTAPASGTPGTAANTMASVFEVNSAGAIGIAGANFGSANQVLLSGGSSAAPSWSNVNGSVITIPSQAQGDLLYRGASAWERLPAGTDGQLLRTNGAAANPSWSDKITSGSAQSTTSGTAFDYTGIPTGTKIITVMFSRVSLTGTNNILVQIGDSGGIETSGYDAGSVRISSGTADVASSSGFIIAVADAVHVFSGIMTIANLSGNTWVASVAGVYNESTGASTVGGGTKTLTATLDRVRITRSSTNTFDFGTVNIIYQ
jgi:hypothetical protein